MHSDESKPGGNNDEPWIMTVKGLSINNAPRESIANSSFKEMEHMKIAQKLSQSSGATPLAINAANKHYPGSGATSVALSPSATSQQQQLHDNMAGSPPGTATLSSSSSAATQRDTNLNHYKQAAASAGVIRSSSSNIAHQPLSPTHKQSSGSQELLSSSSGNNSPNADGMKKISSSSSSNAVFQESKLNLRQSRSASLDDEHEQRRSSVGHMNYMK